MARRSCAEDISTLSVGIAQGHGGRMGGRVFGASIDRLVGCVVPLNLLPKSIALACWANSGMMVCSGYAERDCVDR